MAHSLQSDEGQATTTSSDINKCGTVTAQWLDTNNLGHLKSVFGKENITIDELLNMNENDQIQVVDSLNDDPKIEFGIRDSIRLKSKLKSERTQKDTAPSHSSQVEYQQVIITEAEQAALKSLTDKYEELQLRQKQIDAITSDLEAEHNKQQQNVDDAFEEIVSHVTNRKNSLLNKMNEMVQKYKSKLHVKRDENENHCNELLAAQIKYEENLKQSAKTVSSAMSAGFINIQQRANVNVQLIDEALLQIGETTAGRKKLKPPKIIFDINKLEITQVVELWGDVKFKGISFDIAPNVNVLMNRHHSKIGIEILMSPDIDVYKYVVQLYEGDVNDEKEANDLDEDKMRIMEVEAFEDNIAFCVIQDLEYGNNYGVRVRALMDDEFTAWISFATEKPKKKKKSKPNKKVKEFWVSNFLNKALEIGCDEWLNATENINVNLDEYQCKRIYCALTYMYGTESLCCDNLEAFLSLDRSEINESNSDWLEFHAKLRDVILG